MAKPTDEDYSKIVDTVSELAVTHGVVRLIATQLLAHAALREPKPGAFLDVIFEAVSGQIDEMPFPIGKDGATLRGLVEKHRDVLKIIIDDARRAAG